MILDVFHKKEGESGVGFVAWFVDGEFGIKQGACQSHIAHEIEQFVSCRFVWIVWVGSVEDAVMYFELVDVLVESLSKTFQLFWGEFFVDVYQGVVKASSFDEVET